MPSSSILPNDIAQAIETGAEPGAQTAPELQLRTPEEVEAERVAAEAAAAREAALNRLMVRISAHADFPSLRDSIRTIQKIARSDTAHMRALTDDVLKDVALTGKLLRIINAAYYTSAGAGSITSIPRALALLGFQTVGMLAASLMLFERLPKGRDGAPVREMFSRALMSALLAQSMCHSGRQLDHAYLSALFLNLGSMLVAMHFPDDHAQIEARVAEALAALPAEAEAGLDDPATHHGATEHALRQRISKEVLGLSVEELGLEVASQWGWPAPLLDNLRRLHPGDPEQPATPGEYLRVLCTASDQLAAALHALPDAATAEEAATQREACWQTFSARMATPLSLDPQSLPASAEQAVDQWQTLGEMLGVTEPRKPASGRPGRQGPSDRQRAATSAPTPAAKAAKPGTRPPAAQDSAATRPNTRPSDGQPTGAPKPAASSASTQRPVQRPPDPKFQAAVVEALSGAVARISQSAASDEPLAEVMRKVLDEMRDAMGLQRAVLALRDGATGELRGRLAVGERAAFVQSAFRVPMGDSQDLFSVLCRQGQDSLIIDTSDPVIAARLPRWYGEHVRAPTFVLLPMTAGSKPIGVLYGDRAEAGSLHVGEKELSLLKALRNQLVMAVRLRSGG